MKIGDRIKDNDPRMTQRPPLVIVEILPNGIAARSVSGRIYLVLQRRIYSDGKPRRSGFDLLPT